ncbi:MAG: hypothetical protein QW356_02100 [Candidatus Hadarchaeales archaeon]
MNYWKKYRQAKNELWERRALWVPQTRAIIVYDGPTAYIFWLGGEADPTPKAVKVSNIALYEATKYALKGVLPKGCELSLVGKDELIEQRELFAEALAEIGRDLPEPYYSRFVGLALQIT